MCAICKWAVSLLLLPTAIHKSSIYPDLATSYAGIVLDLLNNERTAMYLTPVQQSQNKLSGFFQGLGLAGPFTGTVTSSGHVQFAVDLKSVICPWFLMTISKWGGYSGNLYRPGSAQG